MVDSCVICCLNYNLSTRRPWDLGCGHCVCEQCYNTSKLTLCVECRQPANNPHLQYTLLRMLQPGSPTSFPIGVGAVDAEDEAPGTPHPSAPIMEVEPLDPDSDSDSRRCSSQRSSSAGTLQCNAAHPPGQQTQHRLSHQSSYSSIHSSSRNSMQCPLSPSGPSAPALSSSFYPLPVLGHSTVLSNNGHGAASPSAARHVPVHALGLSSNTTWRATGGAVTMGVEYTTATADSIVSHQAFLTSFPVEDYDLLECMPESPTSSQADELDDDTLDTAAADEQPSIGRALSAVQGAVDSCTVLVQHLLVPHLLFEHGPRQGWPAPGPSLILAATSSSWRTWSAYSSAMQHTLAYCKQAQLFLVSKLGQVLQAVGLPNSGHLAAYMLATWLLGMLLYHWGLGLQLLPTAAAGLGLLSFSAMSTSSSGCSLWPAKLAGALVSGDCLVVGLLGLLQQQTGFGAAMHSQLLAATPQLLLAALLLVWGQVVFEVISMGWADYQELKFASLVTRCWCVAAAAVLFSSASGSAVAVVLAAIPWAQKCHLLLEAPVVVHHLGLLLQSRSMCWAQQPGPTTAAAAAVEQARGYSKSTSGASSSRTSRSAAGSMRRFDSVRSVVTPAEGTNGTASSVITSSSSSSSSYGAWLLCVHALLQLSLLLFVPPAPLAAVSWVPSVMQKMAMWASRVLLCGCIMQLLLNALPVTADGVHIGQQQARSSGVIQAGSSTYAGSAGCRSDTGKSASKVQSKLNACGEEGASCRPSSSCSMGAQVCMMLAARTGSPCAGHNSWDLQVQDNSNNSNTNNSSYWGLTGAIAAGDYRSVDVSSRAGLLAGAAAVVRQHVTYFVLLLLAAAGDSFITAVPSADGAVRAAWHVCVQQMLVVIFVGECVLAVWHEVMLLRYQQHIATAAQQRPGTGLCRARVCSP